MRYDFTAIPDAAVPQGVHKPGLVALAEGEPVDVPDRIVVGARFRSDKDVHGWLLQAKSAYSPTSTSPLATVVALPLRNTRSFTTRTFTTPPLADT
jgi:hypothetical protein